MLNETFSVIFKHRDNIEIEFENKELSLIICEYSAEKLYIEVSLKMHKTLQKWGRVLCRLLPIEVLFLMTV